MPHCPSTVLLCKGTPDKLPEAFDFLLIKHPIRSPTIPNMM